MRKIIYLMIAIILLVLLNSQKAYSQVCVGDVCVDLTPTQSPQPTSPPAPTATPGQNSTSTNSSNQSSQSGQQTGSQGSQSQTVAPTPVQIFIRYPSVVLTSSPKNPTKKTKLTFAGRASIEQGIISTVEYNISEEEAWKKVPAQDRFYNEREEEFAFTLDKLKEGKYTVQIRAQSTNGAITPEDSQVNQNITVITTSPTVTLDKFRRDKTRNTRPLISGKAVSKLGQITKVEVSFDNGKNWVFAELNSQKFKSVPETLQGGTYTIRARAYDNAGNIGYSKPYLLAVDDSLQKILSSILGLGLIGFLILSFVSYKLSRKVETVSEYMSETAHELKTPMTAMKWYLEMILGGNYGPIKKTMKTPLAGTKESVERLISLVNNMLNVSRIEDDRLAFKVADFSVGKTISDVVTNLQPIAKEKKIQLTASDLNGAVVKADEDKVRQILNNLIGNSLKFTDKGSVKLSVNQKDDRVQVSVTDTGVGIPSAEQQKLFGKFQQADSGGKKREGTGLGLYISRELARKMGGDVWLESSKQGKGSTFAFSLPKASSG